MPLPNVLAGLSQLDSHSSCIRDISVMGATVGRGLEIGWLRSIVKIEKGYRVTLLALQ
jgi:hypothetical protein